MAKKRIDSAIDIQKIITEEVNVLKSNLKDLEEFVKNFPKVKALFEGADNFKGLATAQRALVKEKTELEKIQKQVVTTSAKIIALETQEAKQLAELKLKQQEANAALKDSIKLDQEKEGSINRLRVQLKQAQKEYDGLSKAERDSAGGNDLLNKIKNLDKELKSLEGNTGRFQRNVGDYAGALGGAFDKVAREIERLSRKSKELSIGGDARGAEAARQQITELENITKVAFSTTGSYTEQVKALEKAYVSLAATGTFSEEFLTEFKNLTGEAKDTVNDLRAEINLAASDTQKLDVLIGVAGSIAAGFEIAEGASALLGDSTEDLQKTMVQLQAVMAVVNGLQTIQNALTKQGALTIAVDAIATKGAAAAKTLYAYATGGATVAAKAFRIAILATGIGAFVVLIGALVSAMSSFGSKTRDANADLEDFKERVDFATESLEQLYEATNRDIALTIEKLKQRGAAEKEITDVVVKELKRQAEGYRELAAEQQRQFDQLLQSESYSTEKATALNNSILQNKQKANNADYQATLKLEQDKTKVAEENRDKAKKAAEDGAKKSKEIAERNAKAVFEKEREILSFRIGVNEQVLADENETIQARTAALVQFTKDRIALIELEQQFESRGKTKDERAAIDEKTNNQIFLSRKFAQEKLNELQKSALDQQNQDNRDKLAIDQAMEEGAEAQWKESWDKRTEIQRENLAEQNALSEKNAAEAKAIQEKLVEDLANAYQNLFAAAAKSIETIFTGVFDRQKNRIQEQIDDIDLLKQKEAERVNSSLLSEEQKAARLEVIERTAQAKKEALEVKQRQADQKKAVAQKAFSALNITVNTIESVSKIKARVLELTAASLLNPFLAPLIPLAAAQVPIALATGAIQLAAVLATPIPRFAKGKKASDSYEGLGEVAEAGRELFISRSGQVKLFSQPTLTSLVKGDVIIPNRQTEMILNATTSHQAAMLQQFSGNSSISMPDNRDLLEKTYQEMKKFNQRPPVAVIVQKDITATPTWINHIKG